MGCAAPLLLSPLPLYAPHPPTRPGVVNIVVLDSMCGSSQVGPAASRLDPPVGAPPLEQRLKVAHKREHLPARTRGWAGVGVGRWASVCCSDAREQAHLAPPAAQVSVPRVGLRRRLQGVDLVHLQRDATDAQRDLQREYQRLGGPARTFLQRKSARHRADGKVPAGREARRADLGDGQLSGPGAAPMAK